jgi:hypothetical protein
MASHFAEDFKNKGLEVPIIKAYFDDEVCWIHTPNA